MQLGGRIFPGNLTQGPLAGISCAPFRALVWKYSQPAFTCTEMISCKTIIHQSARSQRRFLYKSPGEGPVCFQLSGNNPYELGEAVKRVTQQGADLIDLNCGCPVKKIRSKGAGSSLLMNSTKLFQLITAMKQNTHVPVSIKIRVEGGSEEKFHHELVNVIHDAGADFVIVHGRHWTETYQTVCNYEQIKFFVNHLKVPVVGNGDIACADSLKKMFATGCAGSMISRAGVGQPWLIAKLTAELEQKKWTGPSFEEIGEVFFEHITQLAQLLNSESFAIIQARKFAKYYARDNPNRIIFCTSLNVCKNLKDLKTIITSTFSTNH